MDATLRGKGHFIDVIKIRTLKWGDDPGLLAGVGGVQSNPMSLKSEKLSSTEVRIRG